MSGRPLKRHAALVGLSREHHLVLQLARAIQHECSPTLAATLPQDLQARRLYVLNRFAREIGPHFDAEDSILAAAMAHCDPLLNAVAIEIDAEHAFLRSLFQSLRRPDLAPATIEAVLDRTGRELEAHVRREERVLFTRLQEVLSPSDLDELFAQPIAAAQPIGSS